MADAEEELLPLLIAVAPDPADRLRLAERLEGVAPLLLVSDLDELRRLISAPHVLRTASDAVVLDPDRHALRYGTQVAELTRLEYALLSCLHAEPRPWSYPELHRAVWRDERPQARADVQSLVKRLRRKLHAVGAPVTIDTVRGVGFRLTEHPAAA